MAACLKDSRALFKFTIIKPEDDDSLDHYIEPRLQVNLLHPEYKPKVSKSPFVKKNSNSHSMLVSQEIRRSDTSIINKKVISGYRRSSQESTVNSTNTEDNTKSLKSKNKRKESCACSIF